MIFVSEMFPNVMTQIKEDTLEKMCMWAASCECGKNKGKAELTLLTTKPRIPEFYLSQLNRCDLESLLRQGAKYRIGC